MKKLEMSSGKGFGGASESQKASRMSQLMGESKDLSIHQADESDRNYLMEFLPKVNWGLHGLHSKDQDTGVAKGDISDNYIIADATGKQVLPLSKTLLTVFFKFHAGRLTVQDKEIGLARIRSFSKTELGKPGFRRQQLLLKVSAPIVEKPVVKK